MGEPDNTEWTWSQQACVYARDWDWNVLPLSPRVGCGNDATPVVKQLGATPLIEPEKASSDPDVIEAWGSRFEDIEIGIVTGAESGVLGLEVKTGEFGGGEKGLFRDRLLEVGGGHPAFVGGGRAYVLIPYAHVDAPLPPITKRRGAVLHGDGSIVYAPWRRFQWADTHLSKDRGSSREVVEVALSMFRLEHHLTPDPEKESPTEQRSEKPNRSKSRPENTPERGEHGRDEAAKDSPLPWQREDGGKETTGGLTSGSDQYFRSGEQLRCSSDGESHLDLPWTVPGGLSVLTGPPKTAGKSSWVLSLASRLAAGDAFLGTEASPSTVVMLADSSPATMRELLAWHELSEESLARLHIAHPQDLARAGWGQVFESAFEHARQVGADLLIADCLDQYITFKGGPEPTESSRVIHRLTARAPSDLPILSVKSTPCSAEEPLSRTIDRLGLLGIGADAVVRLDDVSMPRFPCLRRVLTASRKGTATRMHMCALRSGRYEQVHREMTGHSVQTLLSKPDRTENGNGEEAALGSTHVLSS